LVDIYGNQYLSISAGPGISAGFSYVEGYLCNGGVLGLGCSAGIPSASEIKQAVAGVCYGGELILATGINFGTACKDWSLKNWDIAYSNVSTFYLGAHVAVGTGFTITIPLSPFGVESVPWFGWKDIIDVRRQSGWTYNKVLTELLWR
jgi:hypothetical protein